MEHFWACQTVNQFMFSVFFLEPYLTLGIVSSQYLLYCFKFKFILGNDPGVLRCGFGLYPTCTITRRCKPWGWSCRNHKVCRCQCLKEERYYRHCTRRWGIFRVSCGYQQRFVCRKTPCPKRRRVARTHNFRRIYVIYCG